MTSIRWASLGLCLATAASLGACAEQRVEVAQTGLTEPFGGVEMPAPRGGPAAIALRALGKARQGGTLLLARVAERKLALIADEDAHAVRIVDPDSHAELGHALLEGKPAQMAIAGDGRLYVALRDAGKVIGLELTSSDPPKLEARRELATPSEPVGLAVTPDGKRLLVTSAWGGKLSAYDVGAENKTMEVALAREPRGVAVSADGRIAYVGHALGGVVSKVALDGDATASELAVKGHDLNESFGMFPPRPIFFEGEPVGILGALTSRDTNGVGVEGGVPGGVVGGVSGSVIVDRVAPNPAPAPKLAPQQAPDRPIGFLGVQPMARIRFGGGFGSAEVPRDASQGFAVVADDESVFIPLVLVHRGTAPTGGYGTSESFPANQPAIAQLGADDELRLRVMNQSFAAKTPRTFFGGGARKDGCLLPRAAAVDTKRDAVLVSCLGSNEVLAFDRGAEALALSARARWAVAAGPVGLAVDEETGRVYVWSQFARTLQSVTLAERNEEDYKTPKLRYPDAPSAVEKSTKLAAIEARQALSESAQRGRMLFHGASDERISTDGRACASCHPDGRDDGLTWPTPNGARQTPMLAGRLLESTQPYGWQGDAASIAEHVTQTFKRLGGKGLNEQEMTDLLAYLHGMDTPQSDLRPDAKLVARGKELFHAETVGCATCHTQDGIGSDGARHNVGGDAEVETPSLRFVAGTAPYFHDGRFATLSDMLRETKGKMGWAADMSEGDMKAIEAYLLTL